MIGLVMTFDSAIRFFVFLPLPLGEGRGEGLSEGSSSKSFCAASVAT